MTKLFCFFFVVAACGFHFRTDRQQATLTFWPTLLFSIPSCDRFKHKNASGCPRDVKTLLTLFRASLRFCWRQKKRETGRYILRLLWYQLQQSSRHCQNKTQIKRFQSLVFFAFGPSLLFLRS
jgi:hypothetical protein